MIRRARQWYCPHLLAGVVLLLSCPTLFGQESLRMPLASKSLLLDITRAGGRLVAAGERGHILLSDDVAQSWRQASVPTRQMLTAVHFPSPGRGWAVGHDGLILATIDGGETWAIQRDGLVAHRRLTQQRLERLLLKQEGLRSRLLLADDSLHRVELQTQLDENKLELEDLEYELSQPVQAPPLLDLFFADESHGVAVGAFNTLLSTDDGGANWRSISERLDNPDGYHLNAITGDDSGRLWIAAEGGLLFRSTDGGERWESLVSPYPASWFGIIKAPRSDVLLVFGLRGSLYRSEDGGDSWLELDSGSERSLSGGEFLNQQYALLAGAVGTLLVSDDGGMSFRGQPIAERVNLSAVTGLCGSIIAVGQGGAYLRDSLDAL